MIDGVAIATSRRYPAPAIIALHSNRDTQGCLGPASLTGPDSYYTLCAYGGPGTIGPLIGQPIPVSSTVQAPRSIQTQPGIGAKIVVAPPQGALCWTITSIAFHYHVGLKHYTATVAINLAACSTQRPRNGSKARDQGARRLNIFARARQISGLRRRPAVSNSQPVTSADGAHEPEQDVCAIDAEGFLVPSR